MSLVFMPVYGTASTWAQELFALPAVAFREAGGHDFHGMGSAKERLHDGTRRAAVKAHSRPMRRR